MPKKAIKRTKIKLTREAIWMDTAIAIKSKHTDAAKELVRMAYLVHGRFNVYFTTYNVTTRRFSHSDNMFFKKTLRTLLDSGDVKEVSGEKMETRVYTLTDKGKQLADAHCKALYIKQSFLKP